MSKWKCGICNSEFDNFQAQGFGGTIYCPLCYFKELYRRTKLERDRLNKEYERIYNENCKLREEHNITDIKLLDENNRLKNIIDELEKWLKKEHENGYEVYYLMAIQDILDKLKALKEE